MKNVKNVTEENSPGLYVLLRCLPVICEFTGESEERFLKYYINSLNGCKKLRSKNSLNAILQNKIAKFERLQEKENEQLKIRDITRESFLYQFKSKSIITFNYFI